MCCLSGIVVYHRFNEINNALKAKAGVFKRDPFITQQKVTLKHLFISIGIAAKWHLGKLS